VITSNPPLYQLSGAIADTIHTKLLEDDLENEDEMEHILSAKHAIHANTNPIRNIVSLDHPSIQGGGGGDHEANAAEEDDEDGPTTKLEYFIHYFTLPLQLLFRFTCPPAGEGESCEHLYFLTFFITVVHIAIFSYLLSAVIGAWVDAWDMPQALFGMLLIAVGAEIPDSIESITMAKKGYGSMAVSNCQGTQVINIGIGLGLPWLLTNITGNDVIVGAHSVLQVSAFFQTGIVFFNFSILVGMALVRKENKATLSQWKAECLIAVYFAVVIGFSTYLYFTGEIV
jgi:Ca2+/Na+ antiporter